MSEKQSKKIRSLYRDAIKGKVYQDLKEWEQIAFYWFNKYDKLKTRLLIGGLLASMGLLYLSLIIRVITII